MFCFLFLCQAVAIRHERNLIWAQTPAMRLTVSRLVGIEGDPSVWVSSKKPNVKHISAPHYRWEFQGLGFSYRRQLLVWSETMNKKIQSLMLNGSTETTDIFTGTSSKVMSLAVDWLSGNVYWGDALYNWIMVAPLRQPAKALVYRIVLQEGLDNPHGLAVHPNKGMLFFSDWGIRPRIERCDLLCEERQIVVDSKTQHPRGLVVSVAEQRLYWVDSDTDSVESVLFDGTQRRLVRTEPNTDFFGIALFKNFLFVTEQKNGVLKVYQQGGDQEPISFTLGNIPYGIVMYDEDQQPGDSGPCDNAGCEHICILDPSTGPQCYCGNGFELQNDTKSCLLGKQFVHPTHLYAISDAICQYPANVPDMSLENVTLTSQCFLNDRYGYLALTFDAWENMLYYSGNFTQTISAIPLEIGAKAKVIAGGTGVVKGLAFDWVNGNIFWTDSTNSYIKMARKDGAFQRVLFRENVGNPLGIAVHPQKGLVFWTDIGYPPDVAPKVEMAYMDGTERKVIMEGFTDLGQPNHMYLDVKKNQLYWADSLRFMIRRYDIDSGDIDVFWQMPNVKFFGISIFRDFILWTDTEDMNGIHMARIDLGRKVRGIIHPKYGVAADVITFDISHQPNMTSACDNNQCDQLCLPNASSYTCACGLGFKLDEDGNSCVTDVLVDNFLLVNDAYQKQVYQLHARSGAISALGLQSQHEPIALDFNPRSSHVYWSDNNAHLLARTALRTADTQVVRRLPLESVCDGIAVDYINNLLFFTDTGRDVIGVTHMVNIDFHVTLIKDDLEEPRDIVVSPTDGFIFWSDWGSQPRVARALMDGQEVQTVVNFTASSAWPNGLALDVRGRTLYYADARNNAIGSYHIDTGTHRIMVKEPAAHYFGLFIMGDFLYLTDWKRNFMARMHKLGGQVMQFGPSKFTKLYGVSGFNSSEILRGTSVCMNNTCDHICVPKPLNVQRCLCSDGFSEIRGRCVDSRPSTAAMTSTPMTTSQTTITKTITKTPSERKTTPASASNTTYSKVTHRAHSHATTLSATSGHSSTPESPGAKTVSPVRPSTEGTTDDRSPTTKQTIVIAVSVTAAVVFIAVVLAAVLYYRRRKGYTVPHAKLQEENSATYPKVFYPHRDQETITFDSGIENPTYDVTQAMIANGGGDP